jgi:hypothetical protein
MADKNPVRYYTLPSPKELESNLDWCKHQLYLKTYSEKRLWISIAALKKNLTIMREEKQQ